MKKSIVYILLVVLTACGFDSSFDQELIIDFKRVQESIESHPDEIKGKHLGIADGYRWIVKENFNKLFYFEDEAYLNNLNQLFEQNKIARIEVRNDSCVWFRIRPDYNNSLTQSEWKALWVVYSKDCKCTCEEGGQMLNSSTLKTELIQNNWFKVITREERYIGG